MKLTPISKEEVYKEAYEDYWMDCHDEGLVALPQKEWMETKEAKKSIKILFALLGMNKESK
tara:strand:- start:2970 stop:3152 length:183 start_codon:yes stop_codon:yes gene_type:complete